MFLSFALFALACDSCLIFSATGKMVSAYFLCESAAGQNCSRSVALGFVYPNIKLSGSNP